MESLLKPREIVHEDFPSWTSIDYIRSDSHGKSSSPWKIKLYSWCQKSPWNIGLTPREPVRYGLWSSVSSTNLRPLWASWLCGAAGPRTHWKLLSRSIYRKIPMYIYIYKYTHIYMWEKTWFSVKLSLNQSIEYHSCCLNSSLYIGLPTPVLVPNPYFGGLNYRFNAPCGSLGVHPHLQDPLGVIPCTPPTAQRCCLVGLFLAPKTEGRE